MTFVVSYVTFLACYTASAQTNWAKYQGNPIIVNGSTGEWDQNAVLALGILLDSATYHMWYTGIGIDEIARLGYATSPDKITWTKHPSNPVLDAGPPGTWEQRGLGSPSVIVDGSTYHMWYDGWDSSNNRRIGYATSPDRVTWTKYGGNPVLGTGAPGEWDDEGVVNPMVILQGSTYHMWYGGWDSTNTRTGYATSSDGINWTKFAGNPVLDLGPSGTWDDAAVQGPSVIFDGSTYHMWYAGGSIISGNPFSDDGRIGYATSSDGVSWTKSPNNPVLDLGPLGSWDDIAIFGEVIQEGPNHHMWYSGFGSDSFRWRIGYAIDSTITAVGEPNHEGPKTFSLDQNYPNPFNPVTTIGFRLPFRSRVRLAIFNVLGQHVAELAHEDAEPGFYQKEWIAGVPSGFYFYRLEALSLDDPTKRFVDSKKMLMLK